MGGGDKLRFPPQQRALASRDERIFIARALVVAIDFTTRVDNAYIQQSALTDRRCPVQQPRRNEKLSLLPACPPTRLPARSFFFSINKWRKMERLIFFSSPFLPYLLRSVEGFVCMFVFMCSFLCVYVCVLFVLNSTATRRGVQQSKT